MNSLTNAPSGSNLQRKNFGFRVNAWKSFDMICDYKGPGSKGKRVENIEANYLKLDTSMLINEAFHYIVTIQSDVPKEKLLDVFGQFRRQNFPNIHIAFDGKRNAYAPMRLNLANLEHSVVFFDPDQEAEDAAIYAVDIIEADEAPISLRWLKDYQNINYSDISSKAMLCIKTILKGVYLQDHLRGLQNGDAFFLRPREGHTNSDDSFDLWRGLFQSIILGSTAYLNVDITYKACPIPRRSSIENATDQMQFCSLSDLQESQTRAIMKATETSTDERKKYIMELLGYIDHNQAPVSKQFRLSVVNEFVKVQARILQPPQIKYRNGTITPSNGIWNREAMQFLNTGIEEIKWRVLNTDSQTDLSALNNLCETIFKHSNWAGMHLANFDDTIITNIDFHSQAVEENLKMNLMDAKTNNISIVFVILSDKIGDCLYAKVKQIAELDCGILTQCIKSTTVLKRCADRSTISNILLKANAMLNGTNHCLQTHQIQHSALVNSDQCLEMNKCMVIGAVIKHPMPNERDVPSIAGVTTSFDQYAFAYKCNWHFQKPGTVKIEKLQAILQEQLKFYKEKNGYLPTTIIFYRMGVPADQTQYVVVDEKRKILNACLSFGKPYQKSVKLTIIFVQKNHHTRFFPGASGIGKGDRNNNVPAGTIVDTTITYPNENYFYLVPHESTEGVAKPTKYRILLDDSRFSIDDIQAFTNNLCYLFTSGERAGSIPVPTYYAQLAVESARKYFKGKRLNLNSLDREMENFKVKEEISDRYPMYFV